MNSSIANHEILLTVNGKVYNPIKIDHTFFAVTKFVSCSIAIPVNVSLAFTILCHCYLYRKPRNVFLFAIVFSNLTCFIPSIMELIHWIWLPNVESICHAYVAVVAVPHALVLLNMFLALVDRYLAISHPFLYREKVTLRLASTIVILSSTLTVFLLKFVYIFGQAPLGCEIHLFRVKFILIILVALLLLCTVLNYIVYGHTKKFSTPRRISSTSTNDEGCHIATIDGNIDWIELEVFRNQTLNERRLLDNNSVSRLNGLSDIGMSVRVDNEILDELEMESTRTLLIGVTSLLVVAYVDIIYLSSFLGCQLIADIRECVDPNTWMEHFIKELGLIPAFDGSIIFHLLFSKLSTSLAC